MRRYRGSVPNNPEAYSHDEAEEMWELWYQSQGYRCLPIENHHLNQKEFEYFVTMVQSMLGGTVSYHKYKGDHNYAAYLDGTDLGALLVGFTATPSKSPNPRLARMRARLYLRGIKVKAVYETRTLTLLAAINSRYAVLR